MKKTIITALTLALFTTSISFAQRGYNPGPGRYPAPPQSRMDDYQEDLRIDRIDNIVGLTKRQERDIKRIENRYDYLERARLTPQEYRRVISEKNRAILSVLTPAQRDRLYASQYRNRPGGYGRRG